MFFVVQILFVFSRRRRRSRSHAFPRSCRAWLPFRQTRADGHNSFFVRPTDLVFAALQPCSPSHLVGPVLGRSISEPCPTPDAVGSAVTTSLPRIHGFFGSRPEISWQACQGGRERQPLTRLDAVQNPRPLAQPVAAARHGPQATAARAEAHAPVAGALLPHHMALQRGLGHAGAVCPAHGGELRRAQGASLQAARLFLPYIRPLLQPHHGRAPRHQRASRRRPYRRRCASTRARA